MADQEAYAVLRALARPRALVARHVPLSWRYAVAVFVGGAVGTGLRASVSGVMPVDVAALPWATWAVNVTGSLLLGYLATRFALRASGSSLTLPLLCTGLLGSYTTFSTFAVEVVQLSDGGQPGLALGYAVGSVIAGLAAAVAGIRLARRRA